MIGISNVERCNQRFYFKPVKMCPGVCRLVIGLDMFWSSIPSLQHLGMLLRTCKTIKAECDLVFAVTAMGQGKIVTKMWA